jgi:hypothetical protein
MCVATPQTLRPCCIARSESSFGASPTAQTVVTPIGLASPPPPLPEGAPLGTPDACVSSTQTRISNAVDYAAVLGLHLRF